MNSKFLVLLLTFITSPAYSQSSNEEYSKAKLFLSDYRIVKVKQLVISGNMANYFDLSRNENQSLTIDRISSIKIPKGNHLIEGAIYGTATMALTAVLVDLGEDPLGQPNQVTIREYIGLAAGGAVVGGIIGYFFPKWKSVYLEGKFISKNLPFNIGIDNLHNDIVLKITIPL